jgi:hypothetical protein
MFHEMFEDFGFLSAVAAPLISSMALPQRGLALEAMEFSSPAPSGTIVINAAQRKLYFILDFS